MVCIALSALVIFYRGNEQKKAVFVVGVARSGTSCVSGILDILGVNFGSNFHPDSASVYNPKGDFEDKEFDLFSRGMCTKMGFEPRRPRIINWEHEPMKAECKNEVKRFMAEHNKESFGVKIPLLSLLLPLFLESAQELGFRPKVVVVIRNPDEIVQSWQTRWHEPADEAYSAIAKYYFNILKYARNYDTLVIYFDDVIHHTEAVVNEINRFIPGLKSYAQAKDALTAFIDKELKHHNV